jgi:hypothetical protein
MGSVARMEALWAKHVQIRDDGCWEWTGVRVGGYGKLSTGHATYVRAHRYSWMRSRGPIPDGLHVLHHCDNPPCVNPDHLYLGTAADNARDRVQRLRGNHGSRNGRARFDEETVARIRVEHASGISQRELARRYNCVPSLVSRIVHRRIWKVAA